MKGYFLTLEGPDGSGKSTIAQMLKNKVEEMGYDCILTREPGGTKIGEEIREILLSKHNVEMSDRTEALLYAASRAQHVDEKIRPLVKSGYIVISDRYLYSSLAYQGFSRGLGIEKIMEINTFGINGMLANRTLFFDIEPEVALNRKFVDGEVDRLELEGLDFHKRVYQGYKKGIERYPENVLIIDARKSVEDVFKQCIKIVEEDLNEINNCHSTR